MEVAWDCGDELSGCVVVVVAVTGGCAESSGCDVVVVEVVEGCAESSAVAVAVLAPSGCVWGCEVEFA